MAIFGPRLDRPSAVGTEGRPRATSLTIASLAVVALFVLTGWELGMPGAILQYGTPLGFTVAGAALQTRDRLAHRFVGHLCFFLFGSILVIQLLGVSFLTLVEITGFVVAMLALGLTWANVGDRAGIQETTTGIGMTYVSVFVWIILFGTLVVVYQFLFSVVVNSTLVYAPLAAFVTFAGLLTATALTVWLALGTLPILQLTPRPDRDRVRARVSRYRRFTSRLAMISGAVAVFGVILLGYGGTGLSASGPVGFLFLALGSPVVLFAVVLVGTVGLFASAFAKAVRLVTTHVDASTGRFVAAVAAGGLLFAILAIVMVLLPGLVSQVVLALVLLMPLFVMFALGLFLALVEFGVVPDRAGGPAVAATAMLVAGIAAALHGLSPLLVFGIVAGALLVWDVSTYGLGVTAEVGHLPQTRRLELFHGVLAVGVGALVVAGLWGVVLGRRVFGIVAHGPVVAVVLVLGLLVLTVIMRG